MAGVVFDVVLGASFFLCMVLVLTTVISFARVQKVRFNADIKATSMGRASAERAKQSTKSLM